MADPALLSVQALSVAYGRVRAVEEVSFDLRKGEMLAILGANGAGKSSIVRAVVGLTPARGAIVLNGTQRLEALPSHRRAALGIGYVPEGRRVFADMTVRENLLVGAHLVPGQTAERMRDVNALFPRLAERAGQLAATLSGGEQQMLAIGRALMREPVLLVLDEPSLGLSPILVQTIYRAIADVRRRGISILLAEQSAHMALELADHALVLETGRIALSGSPAELRADPRVREAYLGAV